MLLTKIIPVKHLMMAVMRRNIQQWLSLVKRPLMMCTRLVASLSPISSLEENSISQEIKSQFSVY